MRTRRREPPRITVRMPVRPEATLPTRREPVAREPVNRAHPRSLEPRNPRRRERGLQRGHPRRLRTQRTARHRLTAERTEVDHHGHAFGRRARTLGERLLERGADRRRRARSKSGREPERPSLHGTRRRLRECAPVGANPHASPSGCQYAQKPPSQHVGNPSLGNPSTVHTPVPSNPGTHDVVNAACNAAIPVACGPNAQRATGSPPNAPKSTTTVTPSVADARTLIKCGGRRIGERRERNERSDEERGERRAEDPSAGAKDGHELPSRVRVWQRAHPGRTDVVPWRECRCTRAPVPQTATVCVEPLRSRTGIPARRRGARCTGGLRLRVSAGIRPASPARERFVVARRP